MKTSPWSWNAETTDEEKSRRMHLRTTNEREEGFSFDADIFHFLVVSQKKIFRFFFGLASRHLIFSVSPFID